MRIGQPIEPPSDTVSEGAASRIWMIPNALDAGRCAEYIGKGESRSWRRSAVRQGVDPTRDIQSIEIDTPSLLENLRPTIPATLRNLSLLRVPEERVLLLRYHPGDCFTLHRDAPYVPNEHSCSLLSVIVYLNEGYIGGETRFPDDDIVIRPQAGLAVAFTHDVRHEGLPIVSGEKFALHTFVLYGDGE